MEKREMGDCALCCLVGWFWGYFGNQETNPQAHWEELGTAKNRDLFLSEVKTD